MRYDDFGAPLAAVVIKEDHDTWLTPPTTAVTFADATQRDRLAHAEQLRQEYVHLPQIVPAGDFFLLPPASKNAQEIGTNVARNEFHSGAEITGKPIAMANGFAKTKQEKGCGNVTGKGCSGKPSLFEEERAAKSCDCQELKLLAENIAKLAEVAADLLYWRKEGSRPANEIRRIAQDLRQLASQKDQ